MMGMGMSFSRVVGERETLPALHSPGLTPISIRNFQTSSHWCARFKTPASQEACASVYVAMYLHAERPPPVLSKPHQGDLTVPSHPKVGVDPGRGVGVASITRKPQSTIKPWF